MKIDGNRFGPSDQNKTNNNSMILSFNHRKIDLDISSLPSISAKTKEIFAQENRAADLSYLTPPLKERVKTLKQTITELADIKKHATRNKILAVLGAVGLVACAVALVAGVIIFFPNPFDPLLLIVGGTALSFIIMGIGMLLCGAFGAESELKKDIEKQKEEVEDIFQKRHDFFTSDLSVLSQRLKSRIEETKKTLEGIENLPISSETWKKEIEKKRDDYTKALQELNEQIDFYTQISNQKEIDLLT